MQAGTQTAQRLHRQVGRITGGQQGFIESHRFSTFLLLLLLYLGLIFGIGNRGVDGQPHLFQLFGALDTPVECSAHQDKAH